MFGVMLSSSTVATTPPFLLSNIAKLGHIPRFLNPQELTIYTNTHERRLYFYSRLLDHKDFPLKYLFCINGHPGTMKSTTDGGHCVLQFLQLYLPLPLDPMSCNSLSRYATIVMPI
jgi:hypothetical protein